jgi:hypothetical protein
MFMEEINLEKEFYINLNSRSIRRVWCCILHREPFISQRRIQRIEALKDLSVLKDRERSTNYPVTDAEGKLLMGYFE